MNRTNPSTSKSTSNYRITFTAPTHLHGQAVLVNILAMLAVTEVLIVPIGEMARSFAAESRLFSCSV